MSITSSPGSFWGSENDKLIAKIDDNIAQLVQEDIYRNYEYDMHEPNGLLKKIKGNYFICDGGFLKLGVFKCVVQIARLILIWHIGPNILEPL